MFRAVQGRADLWYFPWLIRDGGQNDRANLMYKGEGGAVNSLALTKTNPPSLSGFIVTDPVTGELLTDSKANFVGPVGNVSPLFLWRGPLHQDSNCRVVSVANRDPKTLVSLIGKAYRKRGGEETFQKLLATIDSRIKKVRIDPGEDGNQVVVDIGLSELLPLAQVGQGVYRLATILADIIGEPTAVLLIDEIENGLHHSVQKQVWTGLAEVARELKVQIFATTHSGECLHAAHKAFVERQPYDLGVIQVFRGEDGVQGRVLDKEHLEAAIAADIELR